MSEDEDDLFGPVPKPTQKQVTPSTKESIMAALAGYQQNRDRRKHTPRSRTPRTPLPPVHVASLSQVKYEYYHPAPLTIFPNSSQLGLAAELTTFASFLGYELVAKGQDVSYLSQSDLREIAMNRFMNNHWPKAIGMADILYAKRHKFMDYREYPDAVAEVIFNHAYRDHDVIQLGLAGFETVNFHPESTVAALKAWAPTLKATGEFTNDLFFEVQVSSVLGDRIITHPFDIVTVDMSNRTHIIELANQQSHPYDEQPGMLIEDALLELNADRIPLGSYGQYLNLYDDPIRAGSGEYWRLQDDPPQDLSELETNLTDMEFSTAMTLMHTSEIHYG